MALKNEFREDFEVVEEDCYCPDCLKALNDGSTVHDQCGRMNYERGVRSYGYTCTRLYGHIVGPHGWWGEHLHCDATWPLEEEVDPVVVEYNNTQVKRWFE